MTHHTPHRHPELDSGSDGDSYRFYQMLKQVQHDALLIIKKKKNTFELVFIYILQYLKLLMKSLFIYIILLILTFSAKAQYRVLPDHVIHLGLYHNSPYSGITFENRITDRSAIEFMFFKGMGLGYKYYITNPALNNVGAYTGISHIISGPGVSGWTEIPIGLYYLFNSNFQISAEVSYANFTYVIFRNEISSPRITEFFYSYALKVGYRFGNISRKKEDYNINHAIIVEAGGAAIDYAIHYDLSLQVRKTPVKVAFAPGFSYKNSDIEQLFFPVNLTIMAGGDLNGEAGLTIPMGFFGEVNGYSYNNFMIFSFPYVGARYQKRSGGIVVKAGIILVQSERYLGIMHEKFNKLNREVVNKNQMLWPSISLGYTIKN